MNDCDCGNIIIIIRRFYRYIFELCNIEKWALSNNILSCKHRHGRVSHVTFCSGFKDCFPPRHFKPKAEMLLLTGISNTAPVEVSIGQR